MQLPLVLLLSVSLCLCDFTRHLDDSLEDLFSDFRERDSPLYKCEGFSNGLRYRIPGNVNCPRYKNLTQTAKAVMVTPFWPDNTKTIQGFYCYSRSYVSIVSRNVWFEDFPVKQDLGPIQFNHASCMEMAERKISPKGQIMDRLKQGQWGTQNHAEPETPWPTTRTEKVNKNFYLDKIEIIVDHATGHIRTTVPLTQNCNATGQICPTNDGMIIWTAPPHPLCALSEKQATPCLLVEDRLHCQEAQFLFTGITQKTVCGGLTVAISEQNIVLAGLKIGEITPKSANLKTIKAFLGTDPQSRKGRSTNDMAGIPFDNYITTQETNLKNSFVYEAVSKGHERDMQYICTDVCKNEQDIYNMAIVLTEAGQPAALGRLVTRNPGILATLNGDALQISHCKEITQYHFLPRDDKCIKEWPIKYILDHIQLTGYVEPLSHRIVTYPTYSPCSSDLYFFNMGGKMIQLGSNSTFHIANLPVLPIKTNFSVPNGMPQLHLNAQGVHSDSEFYNSHAPITTKMLEHVINSVSLGHQLDAEQKSLVQKLLGYFDGNFWSRIKFVLVIGALIVIIIANLPLFWGCCGRINKCRNESKVKKMMKDEEGEAWELKCLSPNKAFVASEREKNAQPGKKNLNEVFGATEEMIRLAKIYGPSAPPPFV